LNIRNLKVLCNTSRVRIPIFPIFFYQCKKCNTHNSHIIGNKSSTLHAELQRFINNSCSYRLCNAAMQSDWETGMATLPPYHQVPKISHSPELMIDVELSGAILLSADFRMGKHHNTHVIRPQLKVMVCAGYNCVWLATSISYSYVYRWGDDSSVIRGIQKPIKCCKTKNQDKADGQVFFPPLRFLFVCHAKNCRNRRVCSRISLLTY